MWVQIEDSVFSVDTEQEIRQTKDAMLAAGIKSAKVYVGDPNSYDSYANGQVLFSMAP